MCNKTIKAPQNAKYLSDFIKELPSNCLFGKGLTGCGGTTLELTCERHSIIAMPFKNLVINKEQQIKGVLGVYEGVSQNDIKDYAKNHKGKIKICTTYDSLPRTIDALEQVGVNAFTDCFLLVDEYHCLFKDYSFRNKAILNLLEVTKRFKKVCFMSATPIEGEFIMNELKQYEIVNVEWQNVKEVTIVPTQTNKVRNEVVKIIKDHLEGKAFGNAHIFVNSVNFIADLLKANSLKDILNPEHVKIVCSDKVENQYKLGKKNYPISSNMLESKEINFYTSTAFEGCDIYDEEGKIYIVSDGALSHTLYDISTLFTQIAGRIRNTKYFDRITHIFSTTRYDNYKDISVDEYKAITLRTLEKAKAYIEDVNGKDEDYKEIAFSTMNSDSLNSKYIRMEDGKLMIDENLLKLDVFNFKVANHMYKCSVNLANAYKSSGYKVDDLKVALYSDKLLKDEDSKISFEDLFNEYAQLRDDVKGFCFGNQHERIALIEAQRPFIKDAYDILGENEVKRLNYNVSNIKRSLVKHSNSSQEMKALRLISQRLDYGLPIESKKVKEVIKKAYKDLGIKQTAKATDLSKWFEVKETTPKVNGKTTKCLTIIREKVRFVG